MTKIDAVITVLEMNPEIAEWYKTEHGVTIDDFTHESVNTYGSGYHGDLADFILGEPEAVDLL